MALRTAFLKVGYGCLFTLVWPFGLAVLARRLDAALPLWPIPLPQWAGLAMLLAGLWFVLHSMALLLVKGGGLPMNAFPPPRCVRGSLYALIPHPIYTGFSLAVAGTAVLTKSPAGFWIVAPLSALTALALVIGYEGACLARRFDALPQPVLGLPPALDKPASFGWGPWSGADLAWDLGRPVYNSSRVSRPVSRH